MARAETWADVMAAMRGARLAAYDDLLGSGPSGRPSSASPEVLTWLCEHGLIVREGAGWRARTVQQAMEWWCPCNEPAPAPAPREPEGQLALFA